MYAIRSHKMKINIRSAIVICVVNLLGEHYRSRISVMKIGAPIKLQSNVIIAVCVQNWYNVTKKLRSLMIIQQLLGINTVLMKQHAEIRLK